jgi:hypothetical protein
MRSRRDVSGCASRTCFFRALALGKDSPHFPHLTVPMDISSRDRCFVGWVRIELTGRVCANPIRPYLDTPNRTADNRSSGATESNRLYLATHPVRYGVAGHSHMQAPDAPGAVSHDLTRRCAPYPVRASVSNGSPGTPPGRHPAPAFTAVSSHCDQPNVTCRPTIPGVRIAESPGDLCWGADLNRHIGDHFGWPVSAIAPTSHAIGSIGLPQPAGAGTPHRPDTPEHDSG